MTTKKRKHSSYGLISYEKEKNVSEKNAIDWKPSYVKKYSIDTRK